MGPTDFIPGFSNAQSRYDNEYDQAEELEDDDSDATDDDLTGLDPDEDEECI